MAMTACRDCDTPISSEAKICPKCGLPSPQPFGVWGNIVRSAKVLLALMFGLAIYQCTRTTRPPTTPAAAPVAATAPDIPATVAVMLSRKVRESAKNPASVQWRSVTYIADGNADSGAGIYCFFFNATNSFGGSVPTYQAIKMTQQSSDVMDFGQSCSGKTGRDLTDIIKTMKQ